MYHLESQNRGRGPSLTRMPPVVFVAAQQFPAPAGKNPYFLQKKLLP